MREKTFRYHLNHIANFKKHIDAQEYLLAERQAFIEAQTRLINKLTNNIKFKNSTIDLLIAKNKEA